METGLLSRFSTLQGLRKRLLSVFEVVNRVGAPLATIFASVALRTQIARSEAPAAPFTKAATVRASPTPLPAHHRDSIQGPGTSAAVNAGRDEDKAARGLASAALITDVSLREPMLLAQLAAAARRGSAAQAAAVGGNSTRLRVVPTPEFLCQLGAAKGPIHRAIWT